MMSTFSSPLRGISHWWSHTLLMWALLVITLGSSFFPDCLANTTKKLQRAVSIEHLNSNGLVRRKKNPARPWDSRRISGWKWKDWDHSLEQLPWVHSWRKSPLEEARKAGHGSWVLTGVCTPAEAFHNQHICKVSLLCGFSGAWSRWTSVWLKDSPQSGHLQGFSPACVLW